MTRAAGLQAGTAPYVVFLDEDDVPDPELLDALLRAQAASGADVVSCGVRVETGRGEFTVQLFAGQPGGLGAIANGYGTVALLRRGAVEEETAWPAARDPDWPILAGCTAAGAQVVSIPAPLVTRRAEAGSVQDNPSEALLAVHALERGLPGPLRGTARLAAGLAANAPPARAPSAKGRVVSVVLRAAAAIRRLSGAPR